MAAARVTEIMASSKKSFADALEKCVEPLKNVEGAWVHDQIVHATDENSVRYRVSVKVTLVLE